MSGFSDALDQELAHLREASLYRELRTVESAQNPMVSVGGKPLLNFSSNDYLGLANSPALREAAATAAERYGTGSGASRLICGSLTPHHELDEALATLKGAEAALSFSSGYAAAIGTIAALIGKSDVVVIDKLVHASIVDAARLSGAKLRVYPHNDVGRLDEILRSEDHSGDTTIIANQLGVQRAKRTLVITESVFSMDGDLAPLREIVEAKNRYGAWLMLDEAHATGIFGANRSGLADAFELRDQIEIQMGTLGKALGTAGGFISGSKTLIEFLINRARSFIFSTAPPPPIAAAATAAIRFVQSDAGEARRVALWARVDQLKNRLVGGPWQLPVVQSPIIPLIVGAEDRALAIAQSLKEQGVLVPAIRYPTVARGQARLRITVSAAHSAKDVDALACALRSVQ
jgi:8-amino-7-oxononanoate synthase